MIAIEFVGILVFLEGERESESERFGYEPQLDGQGQEVEEHVELEGTEEQQAKMLKDLDEEVPKEPNVRSKIRDQNAKSKNGN